MDRKNLGGFGEKIAKNFLKKKGYKILGQNFKRKWGEIDIIGQNRGKIIFFEVKTIISSQEFVPEDQITPHKKRQLLKMTQIYLNENKISLNNPCQIDIIAIEVSPDFKKANVRHHKNAIEDYR
ncbi:MAG: YraN family protein [Candidatus Pacebacteria bacterium]|nr:YraN family protein [Candidatus Paceibacterota bacterium]